MNATVLIIEDEAELAELEALYLNREGMRTVSVSSAEAAQEVLLTEAFDLIILDINLPGKDGFEFLSRLRSSVFVPVIIVSAREADEDIVMALRIGADEFVTKPFAPKVLVAKVRAMIRRYTMFEKTAQKIMTFGPYTLNEDSYCLKREDNYIQIPVREFDLLCFLVHNAGNALTIQEIYDAVWRQQYGDTSAVSVYIQRLRKKIEPDYHEPTYIKTIHGKGYMFSKKELL
jgi:two-component system response regulator RegX3